MQFYCENEKTLEKYCNSNQEVENADVNQIKNLGDLINKFSIIIEDIIVTRRGPSCMFLPTNNKSIIKITQGNDLIKSIEAVQRGLSDIKICLRGQHKLDLTPSTQ